MQVRRPRRPRAPSARAQLLRLGGASLALALATGVAHAQATTHAPLSPAPLAPLARPTAPASPASIPSIPTTPGQRSAPTITTPAEGHASTPASVGRPRPGVARGAPFSAGSALALGFTALGLLLLPWARRRRARAGAAASVEVIAQAALGGRARVLWLRASQREILVAITPQAVEVLDRWSATGLAPRAAPAAAPDSDATDDDATDDDATDDSATDDSATDGATDGAVVHSPRRRQVACPTTRARRRGGEAPVSARSTLTSADPQVEPSPPLASAARTIKATDAARAIKATDARPRRHAIYAPARRRRRPS